MLQRTTWSLSHEYWWSTSLPSLYESINIKLPARSASCKWFGKMLWFDYFWDRNFRRHCRTLLQQQLFCKTWKLLKLPNVISVHMKLGIKSHRRNILVQPQSGERRTIRVLAAKEGEQTGEWHTVHDFHLLYLNSIPASQLLSHFDSRSTWLNGEQWVEDIALRIKWGASVRPYRKVYYSRM